MSLLGVPHPYETEGGEWVGGRYVTTAPVMREFVGTLQPMPARENIGYRDLPGGRINAGRLRIYSDRPLKVGKEGEIRGDVVHYEGGRYEIGKDIAHQNGIIPHYKYIAEYIGEVPE